MSDAPTNVGKHITSNIACAGCHWYTNRFSLLIGPNGVVHYDVTIFPAFSSSAFQMVQQMGCQYINTDNKLHSVVIYPKNYCCVSWK